MRVLVACEYSGAVSGAFRELGHEAWSCDLLPTEGDPNWHVQGDAIETAKLLRPNLLIAHPPCTDLSVSGARWCVDHFAAKKGGPLTRWNTKKQLEEQGYWHDGSEKRRLQAEALAFVLRLAELPIEKMVIENPVSRLSTLWRPADQYINPWQFGHGEVKKTGLWLKGLPLLKPTNIVDGRDDRIHRMPPGPDRWKERSRTYQGIADAMAAQWGALALSEAA